MSVHELARLVAEGAVNAPAARLPPVDDGDAVEPNAASRRLGLVSRGGCQLLAAEILGGRQVGIRIEPATLLSCDRRRP